MNKGRPLVKPKKAQAIKALVLLGPLSEAKGVLKRDVCETEPNYQTNWALM